MGKDAVKTLEPDICAFNAIYSATTGIIDSHALMSYLFNEGQRHGVMFAFSNEVTGLKKTSEGYLIAAGGDEFLSTIIINSAGLGADKIAALAGLDIDRLGYRLHYCKGDYFSISGSKGKLSHLVYPVPHEKGHGLGVHATLDLEGYIRLGPDTTYIKELNYDVEPRKGSDFYQAAKKYLPWLGERMLLPDTAGIRPKLQGPDDGFRDFVIQEESANGLPGLINLIGIESPGLTSCLAIARQVKGSIT